MYCKECGETCKKVSRKCNHCRDCCVDKLQCRYNLFNVCPAHRKYGKSKGLHFKSLQKQWWDSYVVTLRQVHPIVINQTVVVTNNNTQIYSNNNFIEEVIDNNVQNDDNLMVLEEKMTLICPYLKTKMVDPVLTLCGHHFDKRILNEISEYNMDSEKFEFKCPICDTRQYQDSIREDQELKNFIMQYPNELSCNVTNHKYELIVERKVVHEVITID